MRKRQGAIGMDKVREILRLNEAGYSKSDMARSCNVSRHTVRDYTRKAAAQGVGYAQVCLMSESELRALFGKRSQGRRVKHTEIDYSKIRLELSRKGVTRQLLWEEYLRDNPNGYCYAQFCQRYKDWRRTIEPSMRKEYKAGEKLLRC